MSEDEKGRLSKWVSADEAETVRGRIEAGEASSYSETERQIHLEELRKALDEEIRENHNYLNAAYYLRQIRLDDPVLQSRLDDLISRCYRIILLEEIVGILKRGSRQELEGKYITAKNQGYPFDPATNEIGCDLVLVRTAFFEAENDLFDSSDVDPYAEYERAALEYEMLGMTEETERLRQKIEEAKRSREPRPYSEEKMDSIINDPKVAPKFHQRIIKIQKKYKDKKTTRKTITQDISFVISGIQNMIKVLEQNKDDEKS